MAAAAVAPAVWPSNEMEMALFWIGFTDQAQVTLIVDQLGDDLSNFLDYSVEEITSLEKAMAEVTPATNRVFFGMARSKLLKTMVHWAKDFDRINEIPTLDDLDAPLFLGELRTAAERARIRKQLTTGAETRAKEASPGKLKSEKTWTTWEQALLTQLSILVGVNGVPLSYVVREREVPDPDMELTYMERMVAQARLTGPEFEADTLQVHQLIRSYTVGENAAQWIREIAKHRDGRRDLLALRAHYRGEGNNSHQIATAQQMFTTLHYKGEKALEFGLYLDKVKEMFNIFHDCGEPQPEAAKLRFLFDTIESPGLTHTISAIRAQLGQDPTAWTFVTAANHLASQIKPTARPGRQLSSVASDGSPRGKDGSSADLYPSNKVWSTLSSAEKKKIFTARRLAGHAKKKSGGRGSDRSRSSTGFKDLTKMVKAQTKQIAALTGKKRTETVSSDSDSESVASGGNNAGDSFGGRESKIKKKSAAVTFSKKTKSA